MVVLRPFKVGDIVTAGGVTGYKVAAIPNVTKTPAPEVNILTFSPAGPVLAVRPYGWWRRACCASAS